jgi:crossover junction endodeoxyribonuclease RuvC
MSKKTLFMGIDPGKTGGISFTDGNTITPYKMPQTERDISDIFEEHAPNVLIAVLEKVGAMPGQGVKSMFTFGQNYGFLRGMLIAHKIPFEEIRPAEWQKKMQCMSKGDKNVTKSKAQQLFPEHKITHAIADAMLISEFCRRKFQLDDK